MFWNKISFNYYNVLHHMMSYRSIFTYFILCLLTVDSFSHFVLFLSPCLFLSTSRFAHNDFFHEIIIYQHHFSFYIYFGGQVILIIIISCYQWCGINWSWSLSFLFLCLFSRTNPFNLYVLHQLASFQNPLISTHFRSILENNSI